MKTLLITPPLLQLNTPYPATPYLTSYLKSKSLNVSQKDLGLDLAIKVFSSEFLNRLNISNDPFLTAYAKYADKVTEFLQNEKGLSLNDILVRRVLPLGAKLKELLSHPVRMESVESLEKKDQARLIATYFLIDIVEYIKLNVDPGFDFSRYEEALAESAVSFTPIYNRLTGKETAIDTILGEIVENYLEEINPDLVGFTIPFPGNVYGALKSAQKIKRLRPNCKIVIGGGFVNTELRALEDTRIFEFIDYIIFDEGLRPLELLIDHLSGNLSEDKLLRTWMLKDKKIIKISNIKEHDVPFKDNPGPIYDGLELNKYLSLIDNTNPMTRIWSEKRWNKLVLAHGCYWKKCTFCDTSLDYIKRFEPQKAQIIVEQMIRIAKETEFNGFHFVDEAAPPALLKKISQIIIEQNLKFQWWGNIRFDTQFDAETTKLMAKAGCIAVTGGLEVASTRVLELINKGVTIEQVARVTRNFRNVGIYVHAYLIYGYPSQTTQETIDSLEVVRQLFLEKCLDSAYWHEFVATAHSPIGLNPEKYGITLWPLKPDRHGLFALNTIPHTDKVKTPHSQLAVGLKTALYNYMHNVGLKEEVTNWFDLKVPKPKVAKSLVKDAIN